MKSIKTLGILNSELSKVLSDLGHTDEMAIANIGLSNTKEVKNIDFTLFLSKLPL